MANLRIGTCSWKYDSWRGIVYSSKPKINFLEEYSRIYNTVEIDQWFWSLFSEKRIVLPKKETVIEYSSSVPEDFKFSVKMPNSLTLTHFYNKDKSTPLISNEYFLSQELLEKTLISLQPMREKLGPLMLQFEYLNKAKMSSLSEFIKNLEFFFKRANQDYNYAIEIRNTNFLQKAFFEFLKEHNLSFVFLQGYYMPDIIDVYDKFSEFNPSTVIIRLHGADRTGMEEKTDGDWSKIIRPMDTELKRICGLIKNLLKDDVDVYLNVNNHYEGSAPLTIQKIQEILT